MKAFLIGASLLALATSANAQTFAVGGGGAVSHAGTISGVATHGLAAGAAGGAAVNTSQAAGIAVSTPVGGLSAGIGQSNNFTGTRSGVVGALGGSAIAGAGATASGFGVGGGITNP